MNDTPHGLFCLELQVRDYECDLQGVVNNAVYLHYLEHTRHEFLKTLNLDFARLHDEGTDGFVTRIEIDYKRSLKSGDRFLSVVNLRENGALRLDFLQELYRMPDMVLAAGAVVTTVCMRNERPVPIRTIFGDVKTLTGS